MSMSPKRRRRHSSSGPTADPQPAAENDYNPSRTTDDPAAVQTPARRVFLVLYDLPEEEPTPATAPFQEQLPRDATANAQESVAREAAATVPPTEAATADSLASSPGRPSSLPTAPPSVQPPGPADDAGQLEQTDQLPEASTASTRTRLRKVSGLGHNPEQEDSSESHSSSSSDDSAFPARVHVPRTLPKNRGKTKDTERK